MARKRILWLCSWYPNKLEPFNGDFIQRHARAASLYHDIHVIHLAADVSGRTEQKETNLHTDGDLSEQIIYYKKELSLWGRLRAHYRWLFLYKQAIRNYIVKNGKPDLVHVHIPMKAGILGIWLKEKYAIPYIVTEHWGIYNEVEVHNYASKNRTFHFYTKQIFDKAVKFISVSRFLGEAVNRLVLKKSYEVIPNVVDTSLFFYKEKDNSVFRFIHVSNMVTLKNVEGILRAFALFCSKNSNTELIMVGDTDPATRNFATGLKIPANKVSFRGEVSYEQVAKEMQQADCFILFSNIENSPCVIGEALCCGLPVIATRVGGVPELLDQSNGILVDAKQEDQLAASMERVITNYTAYDRRKISEDAAKIFSSVIIGKQLMNIYDSVTVSR
ncbi:MAG TPA: glycosyltransferase [Chitinophagaceae bacterium]|nr:glycosyltransferase [Chitinophagaceae bacterium]